MWHNSTQCYDSSFSWEEHGTKIKLGEEYRIEKVIFEGEVTQVSDVKMDLNIVICCFIKASK